MVDDVKQGGEEQQKAPFIAKGPMAAREEEILAFWNKAGIFEKSLAKPSPKGEYVFYDGPPFATGLPHYGHLLQSAIKDAVPRYRTMQGYHVPRRWGWDCHGLPLENQIEQELGFKTKRDIEQYGIEKFNTAAKNAVLRYASDWESIINRYGRWVDMQNDYRTMDASYTESVWWAFKTLHKKGLIYEGFKSMHYCPRCGTTLSSNEVTLGYKDIDDMAVTVRLPLVDEPNTSILIWTTTPWTLPGNAAAAVNAGATYVKVKVGEEFVIVAKDLLPHLAQGHAATLEVFEEFLGKTLVGKRYEPPFDYFKKELHKHKTHAWKVYAGDFVTLDSGTGIVHIAPAFGADDLALAQKEKVPLIHHVTDEGKFVATVTDFAGLLVKPKGNPRETDEKVIEVLKARGLLFAEEKIKHSYPHCWRCDTPLLNWASNSWFVKVSALKSQLLKQNTGVSWVPGHVGTGRFNNLLATAPDWAISRSRYWGAPLPVWRHSKTKELKVIGSVEELLPLVRRSGNQYFVMRHGEARSNAEGFVSSDNTIDNHLTEGGRETVRQSVEQLQKKAPITLIVVSNIDRARETAAIAQKILGLPDSAVMVDERLSERHLGSFSGTNLDEWHAQFATFGDHFTEKPGGSETLNEVRTRVGSFMFDIERRYSNKNILLVTHGDPIWCLDRVADMTPVEKLAQFKKQDGFLANAAWKPFAFTPYPHNTTYELDLHRPYIDDIKLGNSLDGEWHRVPDVFDCWFESGSMPYASNGYPKKQDTFNPKRLLGLMPKGYPAHFIAEGVDQTRGWFYSLIVLGTGLFGKSPYKAVITNGLILAQDGRKMSKKLKNYPDPMEIVEKFGADALRYYLLSSAVIRGEDLRFAERGVEEVSKKILMRLDNVRSFYELYAPAATKKTKQMGVGGMPSDGEATSGDFSAEKSSYPEPTVSSSKNILDKWIVSRLNQVIAESTAGYESYQLDDATRPIADFVDDLSTWYLRRSRDRIRLEAEEYKKQEEGGALATLRYVLYTLAHIMAPVMPFFAEHVYQSVQGGSGKESVHLSTWPSAGRIDKELIEDMQQTRTLASLGLQAREKAGIKLRQPLALLNVNKLPNNKALVDVLKDELNVKEVVEDITMEESVWLETELTDELREEGAVRDLVRTIQEWRKEKKLLMTDRPTFTLTVGASEQALIERNKKEIIAQTGLADLLVELKEGDA